MGEQLMRRHKVSYLDTSATGTPDYTYMSAGFTDLTDARNPDVSSKIYINDEAESKTIRKYAPEWAFSFDRDSEDAVHAYIVAVGEELKTGSDAESSYIEFLTTDVDPISGLVDARRYPVAIQVDSTGSGAGGEELVCSGTLHGVGDPTEGSFDTADNSFTPDVS